MEYREEAAFWRACCERGILVFASPEGADPVYPITMQKVATTSDERSFLDDENEEMEAKSLDEAMTFIRSYIKWHWKPEPSSINEVVKVQLIHLEGYVLYDEGFGPQNRHLGHLVQSADDPDWYEKALAECRELAETYFFDSIPDKTWDQLKPDLKVHPSRTPH